MPRKPNIKDDPELNRLREVEMQLLQRERESVQQQHRLALELRERERTMPPLEEILERERFKQHELSASRGQIINIRRTQNRSLLLLMLLITATCTLVWWGIRLMQG